MARNETVASAMTRDCGFVHVCFSCGGRIECPCDVRPGFKIVYVTVAFCPRCRSNRGFNAPSGDKKAA